VIRLHREADYASQGFDFSHETHSHPHWPASILMAFQSSAWNEVFDVRYGEVNQLSDKNRFVHSLVDQYRIKEGLSERNKYRCVCPIILMA